MPPYILRPIMRLAYCTGSRRWPCSTNTTVAMMARAITSTTVKTTAPWLSRMFLPSAGIRAAIEVKIRIDMPLPMPRSVISSPIHMIAAVPAVIVSTRVISANALWSGMIWSLVEQPGNIWPLMASARNAVDCRMPSPMVRYRVYWVSLA